MVPSLTSPSSSTSMGNSGHTFATELVIASEHAEARRIQAEIEQQLIAHQYNERELFGVRLALEEAFVNAIRHGNQMDSTKKVRVAYTVTPERFDIRIVDEGPGFDQTVVPDPTAPENLERPCGRGLMLMRHYMNSVTYTDRGTCVTMTKLRQR